MIGPHPLPRAWRFVGTGFGGVATAIRLLQDGVGDLTLLERFADTGGTWRGLEVAEFVHDDFLRWVDDELASSSWADGCASWYLNDRGENFTVWPGTVGSYQQALARIELSDYEIRRAADQPTTAPNPVGAPA